MEDLEAQQSPASPVGAAAQVNVASSMAATNPIAAAALMAQVQSQLGGGLGTSSARQLERHNQRQGAEERVEHNSDDEDYDVFGRKKKKRARKDPGNAPKAE